MRAECDPRGAWAAVLAIAAVAGLLYGWGITHDGLEFYYAASVKSMATSWHLFWFGGFDGAGTLTIDKLPGALWLQALVVRVCGMSTASLVAPQVVAGALSVVAMFVVVRRIAGARAGVLASAIFATMPAVTVMTRGNTSDALCVLLLVLAAGATVKAIENGRLGTLIFAAVYVGLAFQAKMLEAWAILPGLGLAYAIAAPGTVRRRLGRLGLAAVVMAAVSVSYLVAVTLVPAGDRPYVDGSQHNSIFAQVFIYNGVERFRGDPQFGLGNDLPYTPSAAARAYSEDVAARFSPESSVSPPGLSRLVVGPVGRDSGWLLPTAVLAMIIGLVARRRRPRTDLVRASLVLWGAWLITFGLAVSFTGNLLSYYTGMLAPPIAVLVAVGARGAYREMRRGAGAPRPNWLLAMVAGTVGVGWLLVRDAPVWLRIAVLGSGVLAIGLTALALAVERIGSKPLDPKRFGQVRSARVRVGRVRVGRVRVARARTGWVRVGGARLAVGAAVLALLVGPGASSVVLVAAGGGEFDAPFTPGGTLKQVFGVPVAPEPGSVVGYGGVVLPSTSADTWRTLEAQRRYLAAATSSDHGQILIFASTEASYDVITGLDTIVPIGGYSGLVNTPTLDDIRGRLDRGLVALAVVPGSGDLRANDPRILLIERRCVLTSPDLVTRGGGAVNYDCARSADKP